MQNMELNRLSDDELKKINGETGYAPASAEAAMTLSFLDVNSTEQDNVE